jgi:hypothetical protein
MRKFILITLVLLGFIISPLAVLAQEISLGTAIPVKLTDGKPADGDIISVAEGGGYIRTKILADPLMFGVVTLEPALYLYDKAATDEFPVINSGKVYVRVSTEAGPINEGDFVTSSTRPGVGVKAVTNGYVLGTAQESYTQANPEQIGKILVEVNPRFVQTNRNILSTLFSLPTLSLAATPMNALRYIIAAIIIIISFYIGFRFFGRASLKGVEAMGRNPLAKKSIILVVVVNAALTFGVMLIGLLLAYVVVVF